MIELDDRIHAANVVTILYLILVRILSLRLSHNKTTNQASKADHFLIARLDSFRAENHSHLHYLASRLIEFGPTYNCTSLIIFLLQKLFLYNETE